jgi:hypothetical protein
MLIDTLAIKKYAGAVTPLLEANKLYVRGDESLPTRVAYSTGAVSNPTLTIPNVRVQAGRTVALTVAGTDNGTSWPQTVTMTFLANSVSFGTRTFYPENKHKYFSRSAAGPYTISGADYILDSSRYFYSSPYSNGFNNDYNIQLPTTIGTSLDSSIFGHVVGGSTNYIIINGVAVLCTVDPSHEPWKMLLTHAYVPTTSGLVDLTVQIPGLWEDVSLVARQ